MSLVGNTYMIIARMVDVESANTLRSVDKQHRGQIDDVISLMPLISRDLLTGNRAVSKGLYTESFTFDRWL